MRGMNLRIILAAFKCAVRKFVRAGGKLFLAVAVDVLELAENFFGRFSIRHVCRATGSFDFLGFGEIGSAARNAAHRFDAADQVALAPTGPNP